MCDVPPAETPKAPVKPAGRRATPRPVLPATPPAEPQLSDEHIPIKLAPESAPPQTAEPEIEFSDDPDDGKPYRVTASELRCPQCGLRLEPEATQCPGCGRELSAGKKPRRSFEPASLSWDAGMPLHRRRLLLMFGIVLGLALGIPIAIAGESW